MSQPENESKPDSARTFPPKVPLAPCDCDSDPIEGLKRLFVDFFQGQSIAAGRDPASRPVFLRQHGVAHGAFTINPDLPADLRVGVFGQSPYYRAWVRFSSDVQPGRPDLKGTMGIAIKLFGVEGAKLLGPDDDAPTHDFVLQNHHVFFVDTAKDMCEFTCESLHGRDSEYIEAHPTTGRILDEMAKTVPSVLATAYWSVLPFRFGDGRHAKYKVVPVDVPESDGSPDLVDPGYLRTDLTARMRKGPTQFHFLVQFQTNDQDMPLDAATVLWSEEVSQPVHVATLTLPQQDLEVRGQATYGENLAFNIWRVLPEHSPVGSLALARKTVYQASADNRRNVNGIPTGEPDRPRPEQFEPGVDYPPAKDRRIVRAAIHPAIGVARVGNSEAEYFIGPQVADPPPASPGFYRDGRGAIKRQAAEFRIYGFNAAGEVVREITADSARLAWSVHLANKKAAWYRWRIAMDVPEAATVAMPLRNDKITDPAARKTLAIDAGLHSIAGKLTKLELKGGFLGVDVMLGELHTDELGRLRVLGGRGVSATPNNSPIFVQDDEDSFGNANGWHDDVADGPVTATVEIDGQSIPVEPAWVVSAPPNYGPQIKGVRTLFDLLYDLFVQAGWLTGPPPVVSFRRHVYPILQRLSGLQWVNQGFAAQFGHDGRYNFEDPEFAAALSRKAPDNAFDPNKEFRRQILNSFRPPQAPDGNQLPWPWVYGDAMEVPAVATSRQNASISQTQYAVLQKWMAGKFVDDWAAAPESPTRIEDVPLAKQPAVLDRAALEFCLADAFHPGCEVTWPIRHLTMFSKPFRIRHAPPDTQPKSFGPTLTQQEVLSTNGPLFEQGPGDLTRWMALPWQADTAFCRSGYDRAYDPFLPTFWPARVPNQVLSEPDYTVVIDPKASMEDRIEAFSNRADWVEPLGHGEIATQMEAMVTIFGSMGLLEVMPGPKDGAAFPQVMHVATYGPDVAPSAIQKVAAVAKAAVPLAAQPGAVASAPETIPRGANFRSDEEARGAPLPVRHRKS